MRIRSDLKIEKLVLKSYPNAEPFRSDGYGEIERQYKSAVKAWDEHRDSICMTTRTGAPCSCISDPRLANHPLKLKFMSLVDRINQMDREAWTKFCRAQSDLRYMYKRVNILKARRLDIQ